MKIDWKQKLSSRKLWCAVASVIASILTACNIDKLTTEQVTIIVTGIGGLIVYILGESYIDGKKVD